MAADLSTDPGDEISPLEMQKLPTGISYHDWFLGFVVVVGMVPGEGHECFAGRLV